MGQNRLYSVQGARIHPLLDSRTATADFDKAERQIGHSVCMELLAKIPCKKVADGGHVTELISLPPGPRLPRNHVICWRGGMKGCDNHKTHIIQIIGSIRNGRIMIRESGNLGAERLVHVRLTGQNPDISVIDIGQRDRPFAGNRHDHFKRTALRLRSEHHHPPAARIDGCRDALRFYRYRHCIAGSSGSPHAVGLPPLQHAPAGENVGGPDRSRLRDKTVHHGRMAVPGKKPLQLLFAETGTIHATAVHPAVPDRHKTLHLAEGVHLAENHLPPFE